MIQRCYIAGPMRGYPLYNFPAFDAAERCLRRMGWEVYNPARADRELDGFDPATPDVNARTPEEYRRRDFQAILDGCTAIAMLPGWRESDGASDEHGFSVSLGLDVIDAMTGELIPPESTLQEAERLICGPRQVDYSHPLDDFTCTGRMWGALLQSGLGVPVPDIPAELVALMMDAVKASRESRHAKRDNRVDGPGYWGCLDMVIVERARREAVDD